jgi:thiamine biosynthesis protein ThiS
VQAITITVNGLDMEIPSGTTVEGLLDIMEEPVRHDMIVEVNGKFTHLKEYSATTFKEGDKLEVIYLDFGG